MLIGVEVRRADRQGYGLPPFRVGLTFSDEGFRRAGSQAFDMLDSSRPSAVRIKPGTPRIQPSTCASVRSAGERLGLRNAASLPPSPVWRCAEGGLPPPAIFMVNMDAVHRRFSVENVVSAHLILQTTCPLIRTLHTQRVGTAISRNRTYACRTMLSTASAQLARHVFQLAVEYEGTAWEHRGLGRDLQHLVRGTFG